MTGAPGTDRRQESGLPTPSELRAAAALLEREGLAAVARVLRLAAEAEEAVRIRLEAPNAPLFGDLTAALPALLRRLPGRVAVFYAPAVAEMLSHLGTRRANGEPDAFADVATALCPPRPGKRKALSERERDREDLAYFHMLCEDLRALDAEARDLRGDRLKRETEALERVLGEEYQRAGLAPRRRSRDELLARLILRRSSRPVRPELLAALIWARGRKAKKIPFSKLAAWAWERTRAQKGRFNAGEVPAVAFEECVADDAVDALKRLEERVNYAESGRDSGRKSPFHAPSRTRTLPVENARERASKRPKGETDAGTSHHEPRARRPVRVEAPDGAREPHQGADPALREGRKPNPVPGGRRPGVGERPSLHVDRRRAGPPRERLKPP